MTPEEYRIKIENDILKIISKKLSNGQMDHDTAKAIARMVLEKLHPPLTMEQLYQIIPSLDDNFPELSSVVLPVIKEREAKISDLIVNQVHTLLAENNISEANNVLDKALNNKP